MISCTPDSDPQINSRKKGAPVPSSGATGQAELTETRLPLQGTSGQVTEIVIEPLRREGREEGIFVGFVQILEEKLRIRTHQALTGG